jgi:hypothetical protein
MGRTTERKPKNTAGKRLSMPFLSAVSIQVRYKKDKSELAEIFEDKKQELIQLRRKLAEILEDKKQEYHLEARVLSNEIDQLIVMDRFLDTRKRDADNTVKKQPPKGHNVTVAIDGPREMIDAYYKYV